MKRWAKGGLNCVALFLAMPFLLSFWISSRFLGRDRALEGASQAVSLWPGLTGVFVRRAFLRQVLAECNGECEVSFGTLFSQTGCTIGENVYIGPRCHVGLVRLEKDVLIGAGVHLLSGGNTHHFDDPTQPISRQGGERARITVGEGSWIGSGAIILADIGRGVVVGAGAVVTKPLPDYAVAVGVPAKVIRYRQTESEPTPTTSELYPVSI